MSGHAQEDNEERHSSLAFTWSILNRSTDVTWDDWNARKTKWIQKTSTTPKCTRSKTTSSRKLAHPSAALKPICITTSASTIEHRENGYLLCGPRWTILWPLGWRKLWFWEAFSLIIGNLTAHCYIWWGVQAFCYPFSLWTSGCWYVSTRQYPLMCALFHGQCFLLIWV